MAGFVKDQFKVESGIQNYLMIQLYLTAYQVMNQMKKDSKNTTTFPKPKTPV
jgi:hypothetical protein